MPTRTAEQVMVFGFWAGPTDFGKAGCLMVHCRFVETSFLVKWSALQPRHGVDSVGEIRSGKASTYCTPFIVFTYRIRPKLDLANFDRIYKK